MKLKHIISQLNSSYYANLLKQLQGLEISERERLRLATRVSDGWVNENRESWLARVCHREIKKIWGVQGWEFKMYSNVLGRDVKVVVDSNYNDWYHWYRCKELKFTARVVSDDDNLIYKLNWDRKLHVDLDGEDNEWSIGRKVEAKLSEFFYYHNSLFSRIQRAYNCLSKDDVRRTYVVLLDKQKHSRVAYCHDQVRKAIERRFNVEIWVDDLVKVGNMLAKGGIKYKDKKIIERYDYRWIFDFDGDIDEIEAEFNDSLVDNVIYV